MLQRLRWTAIRAEVQRAFNARLKEQNLAPSTWTVGDNPVDRLLKPGSSGANKTLGLFDE